MATTKTPRAAAKAPARPVKKTTARKPQAATRAKASPLHARYGGWALICGSAEGMGAAYAERLAREGFDLVLLDLKVPALEEQAKRLQTEFGIATRTIACDLSKPPRVAAALDAMADLEVGLMVFNAALGAVGEWAEVSLETKLLAVNVNVIAVLTMTDRLSRPMLERGRGGIILTSSIAALQGAPGQAVYAATKSFDLILAESLWGELKDRGVDVLALIPGMVRTPNFKRSGADTGAGKMLTPVEPSEAVDEALSALGKEPRAVPGKAWKLIAAASNLAPRKKMIEAIGKRMSGLKRQP
jgi:hypothetical protein